MDINEIMKYEFLDRAGVKELTKGILQSVNTKIAERIVTEVNASSDDNHTPSALAVYKAIQNSKHTSFKTVTGDIETQVPEAERSSNFIYLQRDSEEDTTWMMYVWITDTTEEGTTGSWFCLGNTDIDLSGYWSKSEGDIAELRVALGIDTITSDIEDLAEVVGGKVNSEDLNGIEADELTAILDEAMLKTDAFPSQFTLTINYVDTEGNSVAEVYSAQVTSGEDYEVESPVVDGYTTTQTVISGVMPKEDATINVEYTSTVTTE